MDEFQELHETLEALDWPEIMALLKVDATGVIEGHLRSCKKCSNRRSQIIDAELADMNPDRRALIIRLAQSLKEQY